MQAGNNPIEPGYCDYDIADLVDKDLKNISSSDELVFLKSQVDAWRNELIQLKKRLEMQFTSLQVSNFTSYTRYCSKEITYADYTQSIHANKLKRVNAARFLQQVELKLLQLKGG